MAAGSLTLKDLENEENDCVTMFMRAKLLEKAKNFEAAIAEYNKVLQNDPTLVNAAYSKAACENLLGRFDDAIQTYETAFKRDVSDAEREKHALPASPYSPALRVDKTPNLFCKDSGFNSIKVELIDVAEQPLDEMNSNPQSIKTSVQPVGSFAELVKYDGFKLSFSKALKEGSASGKVND